MSYVDENTGIIMLDDRDKDFIKTLFDEYIAPGPAPGSTKGLLNGLVKFFNEYLNDPRDIYSGLNVNGGTTDVYKVKIDAADLQGYLGQKIAAGLGMTFNISTGTNKVIGIELDMNEAIAPNGVSLLQNGNTIKKITQGFGTIISSTPDDVAISIDPAVLEAVSYGIKYAWDNEAEMFAETGMGDGDLGVRNDLAQVWKYDEVTLEWEYFFDLGTSTTANLTVSDYPTESFSGTQTTQQGVNQENVSELTNIYNLILGNSPAYGDLIGDPLPQPIQSTESVATWSTVNQSSNTDVWEFNDTNNEILIKKAGFYTWNTQVTITNGSNQTRNLIFSTIDKNNPTTYFYTRTISIGRDGDTTQSSITFEVPNDNTTIEIMAHGETTDGSANDDLTFTAWNTSLLLNFVLNPAYDITTSTIDVSNKSLESITETATKQSVINEENKDAIETLQDDLLNIDTFDIGLVDVNSEDYDKSATTQANINVTNKNMFEKMNGNILRYCFDYGTAEIDGVFKYDPVNKVIVIPKKPIVQLNEDGTSLVVSAYNTNALDNLKAGDRIEVRNRLADYKLIVTIDTIQEVKDGGFVDRPLGDFVRCTVGGDVESGPSVEHNDVYLTILSSGSGGSGGDGKVFVDDVDTTAEYLEDKLIGGTNITITKGYNVGGEASLTVNCDLEPLVADEIDTSVLVKQPTSLIETTTTNEFSTSLNIGGTVTESDATRITMTGNGVVNNPTLGETIKVLVNYSFNVRAYKDEATYGESFPCYIFFGAGSTQECHNEFYGWKVADPNTLGDTKWNTISGSTVVDLVGNGESYWFQVRSSLTTGATFQMRDATVSITELKNSISGSSSPTSQTVRSFQSYYNLDNNVGSYSGNPSYNSDSNALTKNSDGNLTINKEMISNNSYRNGALSPISPPQNDTKLFALSFKGCTGQIFGDGNIGITYHWANEAAMLAETGMSYNALGVRDDLQEVWVYNGSSWVYKEDYLGYDMFIKIDFWTLPEDPDTVGSTEFVTINIPLDESCLDNVKVNGDTSGDYIFGRVELSTPITLDQSRLYAFSIGQSATTYNGQNQQVARLGMFVLTAEYTKEVL